MKYLLLINKHRKVNPVTGQAQYFVRDCIPVGDEEAQQTTKIAFSKITKTLFILSPFGYRRGVRINPRKLIEKLKGQL